MTNRLRGRRAQQGGRSNLQRGLRHCEEARTPARELWQVEADEAIYPRIFFSQRSLFYLASVVSLPCTFGNPSEQLSTLARTPNEARRPKQPPRILARLLRPDTSGLTMTMNPWIEGALRKKWNSGSRHKKDLNGARQPKEFPISC